MPYKINDIVLLDNGQKKVVMGDRKEAYRGFFCRSGLPFHNRDYLVMPYCEPYQERDVPYSIYEHQIVEHLGHLSNDLIDIINEFKKDKIYSINDIKSWLITYKDTYQTISKYVDERRIINYERDKNDTKLKLKREIADNDFVELYENLELFADAKHKESFFRLQWMKYLKVKYDKAALDEWVKTFKEQYYNEELYCFYLFNFSLPYYEVNSYRLYQPFLNYVKGDVYIDRKQLIYTTLFINMLIKNYINFF
mgnify:CR=1 FL=1